MVKLPADVKNRCWSLALNLVVGVEVEGLEGNMEVMLEPMLATESLMKLKVSVAWSRREGLGLDGGVEESG